ncbi:MAG TPA: signal peptidase I [Syntrophomonadaceae bacterium]|nr:signal peptidase I [Syntrophomonadaceae bacterium]
MAAYLLNNFLFGPRISGFWGSYGLPAIMWLMIVIFALGLPRFKTLGKLRERRLLCWLALICVFVGLLGEMIQGAMSGFGKSPYDHTVIGILINLFSLGIAVAGLEMLRSWSMNRFFTNRPGWGIGILSFLSTCFLIPFVRMANLSLNLGITKFIGSEFIPSLAQNVLASYLVLLGGPGPAIIYRGGMMIIERISPILPNANWVSQTLLGVLAPVVGIVLVRQIYREERRTVRKSEPGENTLGWVATSLAAILILWFAMGVFSYYPRVILSGSMQPGINIGDIVIINRVPGEQVKVNDIILFPLGNMQVSHRVVAVQEVENKRFFITKGDANQDPEKDPVYEKQVLGKVVFVAPKLGWITLWLRGAVT